MVEFGGKDFEEWSEECMVCTDFAAEFKNENPNARIKFGEAFGEEHAWAYDPDEDVTLDPTLGQFFEPEAEDNYWMGEEHPFATEEKEFDDIESFAEDAGGTYLLDRF